MKNLVRLMVHTPHGAGIGYFGMLAVIVDWRYCFLCLAWLILCCGYQVIEDWRIHDKSYLDWRGYMVGFWIGLVLGAAYGDSLIFYAVRFVRWIL